MRRNRFYAFSRRLQREVKLISKLHYDHWVLVETDLSILNYCERPLKIVESVAGEIVETTFDMWINSMVGEEFIYIDGSDEEPSQSLNKEIYAQKVWCAKENKRHRVITKRSISSNQIYLSNKKKLLPYYIPKNEINNELYYQIISLVSCRSLTIKNIETSIASNLHHSIIRNCIYALIYHNILVCNQVEKLISSLTEVTLSATKTIEDIC